ncbi:rna-binding [Pyrenophora seminiperda CCB06]|uniref:Rna-binding n=1 Tax=Pyrenophora seminiperda CCB06 TaxID=1302712 RepID=A0A3M7M864_9PLEO|nr:rna-binding [Pyrenophora seminiperda CCB06]
MSPRSFTVYMRPNSSPPQEAEHIRHQSLTPESPRPQNVPSPANIPILVEHMDASYHELTHSNGLAPTPASHFPPQSHPSNANANAATTTPYLANQPSMQSYQHQNIAAQGGGDATQPTSAFHHLSAFGTTMGTQAHDTSSMQNFAQQQQHHHARAAAHDAPPASARNLHSAYPYSHDNAYAAQPAQVATNVDVQALLDSLTPGAHNVPTGQYAAPSASLLSVTTLPPRPPTQDQPATHPNYNPSDDIASYHPQNQRAPSAQQRGNGALSNAHNPPGHAQQQPGLRSETPDDEDQRWPPEVNRRYEEFLEQERRFVTEGQWDQFPMGSRLFIGNLPTEKVTKRDIFHRFYRHGQLAQISIKQAYGFVQFLDSESCRRALDAEQGQAVRGRKMHLEISKPQRNTKKNEPQNPPPRRRSRSPDYTRGGTGPPPRDSRYGAHPNSMSPRDRDRRFRDRDDYRPMRSPSPRAPPRGVRSRDRSRDRFDTRYRSRSRTPPRRHRSPSPRHDYTEDGLDLRRRLPHEVPDIQILVLNEGLPRDFIRYVEDTFRTQQLRSNVLILSGRFPEPAVVRRQILEGVLAIVRLDTTGLTKGKVSVQIFDRRGGANNVQFNEYADLDPTTAGLLVNNAKQSQSRPVLPPSSSYAFGQNLPPHFSQPSNPFPALTTSQPNISNLIASLDGASLSQLLGAMSGNNMPQNAQAQPNPGLNADLARLLAQVPSPVQTPGFATQHQPHLAQLSNQFPALASLFANQSQPVAPPVQTPAQPGPAPDMSEIMAQLAQYQR